MSELKFDPSFPNTLKDIVEEVLKTELSVGKQFESTDSYSYLLESGTDKYVGKIFRFADWPPKGKLEYVHNLLHENHIPHEEIVHLSHTHPIFVNGWLVSKYIPGGTVRDNKSSPDWNKYKYYQSVGNLLKQVHRINFEYYGSLTNESDRYTNFSEYVFSEIHESNFEKLPESYLTESKVIDNAKQYVIDTVGSFTWESPALVHDDANERNVLWNGGNPILIDWVDSIAAPPSRDFATLTFRENDRVLDAIEEGYGQPIDHDKLRFHQIMRLVRLGHFFYFEDKDSIEFELSINRLKQLLKQSSPFGA